MVVALTLFSTFISPVILCIFWGIALLRLKNWPLSLLTSLVLLIIIFTSWDNPARFTRNPYTMLTFTALVTVNLSLIPHMTAHDRPYLVAADVVLLLMMAALQGWRLYLWQSSIYFTDLSPVAGVFVAVFLTSLTLSIPLIFLIERANLPKGWRWTFGLVLSSILLSGMIAILYIR